MRRDFAVKRGRIFTTFQTSGAAFRYWRETLGSVFMVRRGGKWQNVV